MFALLFLSKNKLPYHAILIIYNNY